MSVIGADNWADAPEMGFGQSAPTPNTGYGPTTTAEHSAEPGSDWAGVPWQTAWWKFTATKDGWVRLHSHNSTTTYPTSGEPIVPEMTIAVFIETPDKQQAIVANDGSVGLGARPVYDANGNLRWLYKDTAEVIFKVDVGWTYWIQVGMTYNYLASDPDSVTTYILTMSELVATAHEVVVPAVGPFYNSPENEFMTGVPTIVGGDDALRRDSAGYIDFPLDTNARFGGFSAPLTGVEDWPPTADARYPGNRASDIGVQWSFRYYCKRLGETLRRADTKVYSNAGGSERWLYGTSHYPTIDGEYEWDATAPAAQDTRSGELGTWKWTGLYVDGSSYVMGASSLTEGVNEGVPITSSEQFLADGEFRPLFDMPTEAEAADRWIEWMGPWWMPPFHQMQYQATRYALTPGTPGEEVPDDNIGTHQSTTVDGNRLENGIEFAQEGRALRIEWFEWIARWMTFVEKEPGIEGKPVGSRRAFKGTKR